MPVNLCASTLAKGNLQTNKDGSKEKAVSHHLNFQIANKGTHTMPLLACSPAKEHGQNKSEGFIDLFTLENCGKTTSPSSCVDNIYLCKTPPCLQDPHSCDETIQALEDSWSNLLLLQLPTFYQHLKRISVLFIMACGYWKKRMNIWRK